MDAMDHLRNVLYMLANLHPDYQYRAYTEALEFYNAARPDARIEPNEGYETHLVSIGPLERSMDAADLTKRWQQEMLSK
jgi:hypothetical protein